MVLIVGAVLFAPKSLSPNKAKSRRVSAVSFPIHFKEKLGKHPGCFQPLHGVGEITDLRARSEASDRACGQRLVRSRWGGTRASHSRGATNAAMVSQQSIGRARCLPWERREAEA